MTVKSQNRSAFVRQSKKTVSKRVIFQNYFLQTSETIFQIQTEKRFSKFKIISQKKRKYFAICQVWVTVVKVTFPYDFFWDCSTSENRAYEIWIRWKLILLYENEISPQKNRNVLKRQLITKNPNSAFGIFHSFAQQFKKSSKHKIRV